MDPHILGENLGKHFGGRWVLVRCGFEIGRGESVALFGKNGSGKSTLLRMIAGLLDPTTGRLLVCGVDVRTGRRAIRQSVRYLAHEKQLYPSLTAIEHLRLAADLRQVPATDASLTGLLERMGIAGYSRYRVEQLSEGTKKRLVLARLLIGEPELILLDEPHPTLDDDGKRILNNLIGEWRKSGKTIVLASHDHDVARGHVDRVLTLKNGVLE